MILLEKSVNVRLFFATAVYCCVINILGVGKNQ